MESGHNVSTRAQLAGAARSSAGSVGLCHIPNSSGVANNEGSLQVTNGHDNTLVRQTQVEALPDEVEAHPEDYAFMRTDWGADSDSDVIDFAGLGACDAE